MPAQQGLAGGNTFQCSPIYVGRCIIAGTDKRRILVCQSCCRPDIDPERYVEEHGLKSDNDEDALRATIEQIVKDNPQSVEDYHNGKEKAIGFLVGQTMKATKGKANPGIVNKILKGTERK